MTAEKPTEVEKYYRVSGMRPAQGRQVNEFLKTCDLGVEGAFVQSSLAVELRVGSEKVKEVPNLLKRFYEEERGWIQVSVTATK